MTTESKDRAALREMLACFADLGGTRGPRAAAVAEARAALAQPDPAPAVAEALRSIARDNLHYDEITAVAEAALAKVQS